MFEANDGVNDTETTDDEAVDDDQEDDSDDDTRGSDDPSDETTDDDDKDDDGDDDFVPDGMKAEEFAELPESVRERLQSQEEDLTNYRQMAKGRKGRRSLPSEGDRTEPGDKPDKSKKVEGVSPKEYRQNNQQMAIRVAETDRDMPRLVERWDDVMGYYKSEGSDGTFNDYSSRIAQAYADFEKANPERKGRTTDTTKKREVANAAAHRSKPSPGKKKSQAKTRTRILPKGGPMSDWYGKGKKK